MTVKAQLKDHKRNHPNFFMIAGEHKFSCECMHCVVFLVDGLHMTEDCMTDEDKTKFKLIMDSNELTNLARQDLRKLFNEYL